MCYVLLDDLSLKAGVLLCGSVVSEEEGIFRIDNVLSPVFYTADDVIGGLWHEVVAR